MAHADCGPSYLYIAKQCPASVTKARGIRSVSSIHARRGTAAHAVGELMIADKPIPESMTIDGEVIAIDDEIIDGAKIYARFANFMRYDADYFEVENKLSLAWFFDPNPMPEPFFGTADLISYNALLRALTVADFKFGRGYVEVVDNDQAMAYGLMAFEKIQDAGYELPTTVRLVIIQPRAGEEPIRAHTITAMELMTWAQDVLVPTLKRIAAGDETEKPGDHCHFCRRNGECASLRNTAIEAARAVWVEEPEQIAAAVEAIDNETLASILERADFIEQWISAVRSTLAHRLEIGQTVPGFKLVEKRANRKWADEKEAAAALSKLVGDKGNIFTAPELLSPAQLEKLLKRIGLDQKAIEPFVTRQSSGTTIVRVGDGRAEVSRSSVLTLLSD